MAYLPLSTANLPDPVIDPAQGASPEDYFNTVLWTGDSSVSRSITGVGHQPDMLWIKNRSSSSYNHHLVDAVRGVSNRLVPNGTQAEAPSYVNSFESDGFELNSDTTVNGSGNSYVGWNWKANGSGVTNTDGSITSTVSANTTSGFSVVSYTGTGSAGTVGHGLDQAPEFIIVKNRTTSATNWRCYHKYIASDAETDYITLDSTAAAADLNFWNDTAPTSSVFSVFSYDDVNKSASNMIAYCFHSVEGFSKFGSYVGNGSADGTFVYTGFRPSFVMIKGSTVGSNWTIYDNKRDTSNTTTQNLRPNTSGAETTDHDIDILSNGFKNRGTGSGGNASGQTYIYACFSENPFKYSNAR